MHEYGLAQDVVEQLKSEVERAGARRLVAADIEVGAFSHASAEYLAFWVEEGLRQGQGPGKDAAVRVLRASPSLFCRDCQRCARLSPPEDEGGDACSLPAGCPHCGSSRVMVRGSTGCTIRRLELER
jgi:Zn finger protein HypA/HybF involved in hydrogenase expression